VQSSSATAIPASRTFAAKANVMHPSAKVATGICYLLLAVFSAYQFNRIPQYISGVDQIVNPVVFHAAGVALQVHNCIAAVCALLLFYYFIFARRFDFLLCICATYLVTATAFLATIWKISASNPFTIGTLADYGMPYGNEPIFLHLFFAVCTIALVCSIKFKVK
jgi:hypothetical protein